MIDPQSLLKNLIQIGIALSSERDLPTLLSRILTEARHFTRAEAGTLFLREGPFLVFAVAQNDALARRLGSDKMRRHLASAPVPLDTPSLAGYVAQTGKVLNIPDAYGIPPGRPYRFNPQVDRRNRYRTESVLVVPLQEPSGSVIGVLQLINALDDEGTVAPFDAEYEDFTRMLASHAAVVIRNTRLEELAVKTQQKLIQSAKLAAIGELAASVAHELNNPLTIILASAHLLNEELSPDLRAREKLHNIETAAERATKISRDLLDFARRREPTRQLVSLHELIQHSLELSKAKLGAAAIEVRTVFDPAVPQVLADPDQLMQVFINLFANAADAMPLGGRLVVSTSLQQDGGRRSVGVSVADTGIGLDEEQCSRIFDPFYTNKPQGKGTGLGLSVSLGIVEMHGGTIHAESQPGKGTRILVDLPVPS